MAPFTANVHDGGAAMLPPAPAVPPDEAPEEAETLAFVVPPLLAASETRTSVWQATNEDARAKATIRLRMGCARLGAARRHYRRIVIPSPA
jgi:hypothetical protein